MAFGEANPVQADNTRAVVGHNRPPADLPALTSPTKSARTIRVVASLVETALELPPGTVLAPGRGDARKQLAVHIFVYVLIRSFKLGIVSTSKAIDRDRGHMRKNVEELDARSGKSDAVARALTKFGDIAVEVVSASNGIADKRLRLAGPPQQKKAAAA